MVVLHLDVAEADEKVTVKEISESKPSFEKFLAPLQGASSSSSGAFSSLLTVAATLQVPSVHIIYLYPFFSRLQCPLFT